jgi:hypothetical protein
MPAIQSELRVQIEGGQAPLLVKREMLQVNSCEQISLFVDGVKPEEQKAAAVGKKAAKPKAPQKRLMKAVYRPTLANVKFVAIYDGGQASGLRVKVGGAKFAALTQPLVFMDRAASSFGAKPTIVLENESPLPRTAVMLVGSDLPKEAKKVELVKRALPAPKQASKKAANAADKKAAGKKAGGQKAARKK